MIIVIAFQKMKHTPLCSSKYIYFSDSTFRNLSYTAISIYIYVR